jgi:hypothetical protein
VHLGFDIFKMATVVLVTMKVFVNPIAMKLHRNDTWEVHMFNKYSLNYEFQNIEYEVSGSNSEILYELRVLRSNVAHLIVSVFENTKIFWIIN